MIDFLLRKPGEKSMFLFYISITEQNNKEKQTTYLFHYVPHNSTIYTITLNIAVIIHKTSRKQHSLGRDILTWKKI